MNLVFTHFAVVHVKSVFAVEVLGQNQQFLSDRGQDGGRRIKKLLRRALSSEGKLF